MTMEKKDYGKTIGDYLKQPLEERESEGELDSEGKRIVRVKSHWKTMYGKRIYVKSFLKRQPTKYNTKKKRRKKGKAVDSAIREKTYEAEPEVKARARATVEYEKVLRAMQAELARSQVMKQVDFLRWRTTLMNASDILAEVERKLFAMAGYFQALDELFNLRQRRFEEDVRE